MDASKQPRVTTTIPPRTIDVHKFAESRASELEALHSIVANRLNKDFRSNRSKRRRTTGYDDRVGKKKHRKRQRLGVSGSIDDLASVEEQRKVPRRVRRRNELKKNPESGFITSGDGTKRLRTHVWHAKRFTMTKMWGFHLPLGLHGRGMGSRSLLKKFRDGVLIHDASYHGAVQLEGPQDSLVHMLARVLVPCESSQSEDTSVLSGITYGIAMLHHAGAPFSPIAPVKYMWQPLYKLNSITPMNCPDVDSYKQCSSPMSRKLLIWIHASAFDEGYDALKLACQKQMDEADASSINCISLQGKLAILELMGSKALEVLQKILHPITSDAENRWNRKTCSYKDSDMETHPRKLLIPENIPSSAIISLTVSDPRISPEKKYEFGIEKTVTSKEMHVKEEDKKSMEISSTSAEESTSVSENSELWESSKNILPPVEEHILCMEKQQQQLAFFRLENTNLEKQRALTKELTCRFCPIMILNGRENKGSVTRLSIILPLSWVKPFWGCLVSNGAHAIGLREKHWVASDAKLPCFPSDFPDCNSYVCHMATKAAESEENLKRRPLAMRPFSIPIPPPWETIRSSINSEVIQSKNTHLLDPCETNLNRTIGPCGSSFQFFLPRTSNILAQFLGEIGGHHLLLFPHLPDLNNNISVFMKNDDKIRERSHIINYGQRLCFLRVVLEACRGGVFEEGAVVCFRTNDDKEEVQMADSSVRSYFQQQPSEKWDLQVPEDAVAKSSHRWPIGFVTSGFVRGSKKPSAIAFCEATLLAHLREGQWKETPVRRRKKEIYVLVRNLRSTTYNLALANILLEHQEDDLSFG